MDELKAEVKEAFPGARAQEQGNNLIFTMPNGQKVTFTFHESITVSDDELSRAKREHGIDQRVTVTVEGYAESVGKKSAWPRISCHAGLFYDRATLYAVSLSSVTGGTRLL